MPTYEYRCESGHHFERVQKMSDKPVGKCPECGRKAERVISGGQGVIFKGSGFYITDYGKDGKGPRKDVPESGSESKLEAKQDSSTKSSAEPAATPKADPKPAATPKAGKPDAT
jgi:putative FmdB family regulatory protein